MVRLPVKTIERELDRLEHDYQCRVDEYALALFDAYVRPFCDRYGVGFGVGNGAFCFYDPNNLKRDLMNEWTVDGFLATAPKKATRNAPAGWQAILQLDDIPAPMNNGYGILTRMPSYFPKKGT